METVRRSLRNAPVVRRDDYEYFVHGVTDGIPPVDPTILREIATAIEETVDLGAVDVIVTPEAMGIHHATALSLSTGLPFVVVRKRSYGFTDEVVVQQETGYGGSELYLNGVEPGDRVLILDDVLSGGGTIRAVWNALTEAGAVIEDIVVVCRRVDVDSGELARDVTSLVDVRIEGGNVEIVS